MSGLLTASRCLMSRGPSVAPTFAVLAVFWMTERDSRTGRGGSTSCQNSIGRESPSCMSGTGVKAGFGIVVGENVDVGEDPAED